MATNMVHEDSSSPPSSMTSPSRCAASPSGASTADAATLAHRTDDRGVLPFTLAEAIERARRLVVAYETTRLVVRDATDEMDLPLYMMDGHTTKRPRRRRRGTRRRTR
jgi:hypothetical protein